MQASVEESVAFLKKAIAMNTVSHTGNELALAELMSARMSREGIDCRIYPLSGKRANLVARLDSGRKGPCVVLTGHMDTVPVGSEPWRFDPFTGVIEDGRLYGRGTSDMKSGLVALMFVLLDFARRPEGAWCGELILAATSTEETGSEGATILLGSNQLPRFDGLIVAEPTNSSLVTAHKGAFWAMVRSHGRAGHSSMPDRGVNAIDKMIPFYRRLKDLKVRGAPHHLLSEATLSVTMIDGGKHANVIPDRCDLTLDVRTLPGQSHEELLREMNEITVALMHEDPSSKFDIHKMLDIPAVSTRHDSNLVAVAQRVLVEHGLSVQQAQPKGAQYFTDASVLQELGKDIIVIGPGDPALAHQVDECVELSSFIKMQRIYANILEAYMDD